MRRQVRDMVGADIVVGFLQGCCGDVDPNLVSDGEFQATSTADADHLGQQLADAVTDALDGPLISLAEGEPSVDYTRVDLPLDPPSPEALVQMSSRPGIWGEWSRLLLAEPERLVDRIPLQLSMLTIANGLALLGLDAEVTVAYGRQIKEQSAGSVLPLPYTNGMIGYVVTADQLRAGGYEPDESYPYVYRPGRFAYEVEKCLNDAVDLVIRRSITS